MRPTLPPTCTAPPPHPGTPTGPDSPRREHRTRRTRGTVADVGIKYIWQLDLTAWGWIHLLIGAAIITVAIFLLRGARWAAWAGIALAGLSALANFLFIPYAPIWAIVIIALDVAIIWALATRRETIHLFDD